MVRSISIVILSEAKNLLLAVLSLVILSKAKNLLLAVLSLVVERSSTAKREMF